MADAQHVETGFATVNGAKLYYEIAGAGRPLVLLHAGLADSRMWDDQFSAFAEHCRVVRYDLRGFGKSTLPTSEPYSYADDLKMLLDHLGIRQFLFFGNCIGGSFALKLMERAPERIAAAVLSQPIGHRPENPDVMYNLSRDVWAKEFRERRPDVSMETIERYLHNLFRARPDFVYSVSREFVRHCQTPMLVLPDDTPAHAYQTAIDVASLAPNAEITVYPWKDPPELKARTINRVRAFLKAHVPVTAAR